MDVTVIVPWRPGCRDREHAWEWVRGQYAATHPGWEVVEAPGPDPWVKAAAVMPAVAAADADIVVVADADVWVDNLQEAVDKVAGGAGWAIPHGQVYRLTRAATATVIAGQISLGVARQELVRARYHGVEGGGIVVASRQMLLDVPMDPRFINWGQEDESWAFALHCLAGPAWRGQEPLTHLFHPLQPRQRHKVGSPESWALRGRYYEAREDPDRMRELLNEVRDVAREPDGQAVHDHAQPRVG